MVLVEDVLIDEHIGNQYFNCNLSECKGACCTFPGEFGAPVLDEEVEIIEKSLKFAKEYLSEQSLDYITKNGFIEGEKGNYTTVCIDKKDCVFVFYEGEIALCSIEKAYRDGKIDFMKPISCHLFPIREGNFGSTYIYYEQFDVCKPAPNYGKNTDIKIFQLTKDALIRRFGQNWYDNYLNELNNIAN